MCHITTNKYGIYVSNDVCYWRLRPLSTPHTMSTVRVCAPLGIRTAPERQEALQALISFICRCAACLLPSKQTCGDTVQRQTTHNIYGHLVIWSFGQSAKKKVCQNLYSIIYIYILYYSPNDTLSFFENDQMTK